MRTGGKPSPSAMPLTSCASTRMASKTVAKLAQTQLHRKGGTGCLQDLPSEHSNHRPQEPYTAVCPAYVSKQHTVFRYQHIPTSKVHFCFSKRNREGVITVKQCALASRQRRVSAETSNTNTYRTSSTPKRKLNYIYI